MANRPVDPEFTSLRYESFSELFCDAQTSSNTPQRAILREMWSEFKVAYHSDIKPVLKEFFSNVGTYLAKGWEGLASLSRGLSNRVVAILRLTCSSETAVAARRAHNAAQRTFSNPVEEPANEEDVCFTEEGICFNNVLMAIEAIYEELGPEFVDTPEFQTLNGPIRELAELGFFEKVEYNYEVQEFTFHLNPNFSEHEDVQLEEKNGSTIITCRDTQVEFYNGKFSFSSTPRLPVKFETPEAGLEALSAAAKDHGISNFDLFKDTFLPKDVEVTKYTENGTTKMKIDLKSSYKGNVKDTGNTDLQKYEHSVLQLFRGADIETQDSIVLSFEQRDDTSEKYIKIENGALKAKANLNKTLKQSLNHKLFASVGGKVNFAHPFSITEIREVETGSEKKLGLTGSFEAQSGETKNLEKSLWFSEYSFSQTFGNAQLAKAQAL